MRTGSMCAAAQFMHNNATRPAFLGSSVIDTVRMRAGSHHSARRAWSRAHSYTRHGHVRSRCRVQVGVGSQVRGAPVSFKVCSADQCWVVCPALSQQPCSVLRARARTTALRQNRLTFTVPAGS